MGPGNHPDAAPGWVYLLDLGAHAQDGVIRGQAAGSRGRAVGENGHGGPERSAADLERAGRAALGRPVTVQAKHSRVEPVNGASGEDRKAVSRSPQEIEDEIVAARANLAATLDELVDRVKPANVARRTSDKVRAQFVDPDTGAPRMERIVPLAGGIVGLLALVVLVKRRGGKDD